MNPCGVRASTGQRWVLCIGAVVAFHALALAGLMLSDSPQGVARIKTGQAMSARIAPANQAEVPVPMFGLSPISVADQLHPLQVGVPITQSSSSARATSAQAGDEQEGDSDINLEGYVPRRWLTVAPQPTAPVLLPYPEAFKDRARYRAVLNLFIEADGRVSRVEFQGIELPGILERTARVTFEHARFTPGQVKGRIVKSLIQVEVNFDGLGAS